MYTAKCFIVNKRLSCLLNGYVHDSVIGVQRAHSQNIGHFRVPNIELVTYW